MCDANLCARGYRVVGRNPCGLLTISLRIVWRTSSIARPLRMGGEVARTSGLLAFN